MFTSQIRETKTKKISENTYNTKPLHPNTAEPPPMYWAIVCLMGFVNLQSGGLLF